ncbi:molybdopterin oxidoreductase family protein, partial [Escherichia coli]|uniref:molybdopterin oxidoreductase family protein n=1 Tax=Escherichia coli TaxID=562 RepID=UPI003C2CB762
WVQSEDLQVAIRPSTDGALFVGLLAEIERQGLLDVDFIRDRTVGFEAAIESARPWRPERVEAATDVPANTVRELARLIGTAKRCMILHARGPEQQTMGTDNVLAMINVALACGHIGKPSCGINMLTGQRNGQGGREWGQRCNQLPAGRSISDPAHRT